jgi:hypothetical protein
MTRKNWVISKIQRKRGMKTTIKDRRKERARNNG